MSSLEEQYPRTAELVVGGKEETKRTEDGKSQKVKGWVEVGESITSRCLQHIDAVDVKILLSRMRNDARKAVGINISTTNLFVCRL